MPSCFFWTSYYYYYYYLKQSMKETISSHYLTPMYSWETEFYQSQKKFKWTGDNYFVWYITSFIWVFCDCSIDIRVSVILQFHRNRYFLRIFWCFIIVYAFTQNSMDVVLFQFKTTIQCLQKSQIGQTCTFCLDIYAILWFNQS